MTRILLICIILAHNTFASTVKTKVSFNCQNDIFCRSVENSFNKSIDCNTLPQNIKYICRGTRKALALADCNKLPSVERGACIEVQNGLFTDRKCQVGESLCQSMKYLMKKGNCKDLIRKDIQNQCLGLKLNKLSNQESFINLSTEIKQEIQNECPPFDHQKYFPPEKNQGNHGFCWAFAASGLLEEIACKERHRSCGKELSVVDLMRLEWNFGKTEGSIAEKAIATALQFGVCLDKYAPYPSPLQEERIFKNIQGHVDYLRGKTEFSIYICDGSTLTNNLTEILYKGNSWINEVIDFYGKNRVNSFPSNFQEMLKDLHEYNPPMIDYLRKGLISKECSKNRIIKPFEDYKLNVTEYTDESSILEAKESLKTAFKSNASIILDLCYLKIVNPLSEKCGLHSMVVNGMRLNTQTQTCEVNLRNSHGNFKLDQGWYDIDKILEQTKRSTYLSK